MSYSLTKKLCPAGLKNNPNRGMKPISWVTIHNTGNYAATADAAAHANLLYSGSGSASWHYSVDAKGVWQSFEDERQCWHAGDGNDGPGNYTSIGIEICVHDKTNFVQACENASELVAGLLKKHNLTIDRVVQHNRWTGKNCPAEIRSGAWGITWGGFINKVKSHMAAATGAPILGPATATVSQAKQWAKNKGATETFISLAGIFWATASKSGVDPTVVYCQSAKETGYGNFKGVLDEGFKNPCGMKTADGGGDYDKEAHKRFDTWADGIQAQIDHIALYAGADGYPKLVTPDPRHFPYLLGRCKTVEELGGNWAPSATYGNDIVRMAAELKNTAAAAQPGTNIAPVPEWQKTAFKKLVDDGIIKTPEYWEQRLADVITIGEVFAVIANMG